MFKAVGNPVKLEGLKELRNDMVFKIRLKQPINVRKIINQLIKIAAQFGI